MWSSFLSISLDPHAFLYLIFPKSTDPITPLFFFQNGFEPMIVHSLNEGPKSGSWPLMNPRFPQPVTESMFNSITMKAPDVLLGEASSKRQKANCRSWIVQNFGVIYEWYKCGTTDEHWSDVAFSYVVRRVERGGAKLLHFSIGAYKITCGWA